MGGVGLLGFRIDHLFHVAVVCGDQAMAPTFQSSLDHPGQAQIQRLNSFHRRIE
ncbi:hypothetical protein D3C79_1064370 [compost metagenome]